MSDAWQEVSQTAAHEGCAVFDPPTKRPPAWWAWEAVRSFVLRGSRESRSRGTSRAQVTQGRDREASVVLLAEVDGEPSSNASPGTRAVGETAIVLTSKEFSAVL